MLDTRNSPKIAGPTSMPGTVLIIPSIFTALSERCTSSVTITLPSAVVSPTPAVGAPAPADAIATTVGAAVPGIAGLVGTGARASGGGRWDPARGAPPVRHRPVGWSGVHHQLEM